MKRSGFLEDDCDLKNNQIKVLTDILKKAVSKTSRLGRSLYGTGSRYLHPDGTLERYDFDKMCSWLVGKCSYLPKKEQSPIEEAEWIQ